MVYQDIDFKMLLSLFGWKEFKMHNLHIVQCIDAKCGCLVQLFGQNNLYSTYALHWCIDVNVLKGAVYWCKMWMHSPASRLKFAASFEQELPSSLTVATIIILRLILILIFVFSVWILWRCIVLFLLQKSSWISVYHASYAVIEYCI